MNTSTHGSSFIRDPFPQESSSERVRLELTPVLLDVSQTPGRESTALTSANVHCKKGKYIARSCGASSLRLHS